MQYLSESMYHGSKYCIMQCIVVIPTASDNALYGNTYVMIMVMSPSNPLCH